MNPKPAGGSTVQVGDTEAWDVWAARCHEAAEAGKFVSDALTRDDYPGTGKGWESIVAKDRKWKRLAKDSPLFDDLHDPAPKRSMVPGWLRRSLVDLDDNEAVGAAAEWLSSRQAGREVSGLMLVGPVGVGKSSIAAALAVDCGEPNQAGYWTTRQLVADELNHHRDGGNVAYAPVDRALSKPLLVLDDLGREADWPTARQKVAEMVHARHARQQQRRDRDGRVWCLVVTTNLTWKELEATYGEAIASRLRELCRPVLVEGVDRRVAA